MSARRTDTASQQPSYSIQYSGRKRSWHQWGQSGTRQRQLEMRATLAASSRAARSPACGITVYIGCSVSSVGWISIATPGRSTIFLHSYIDHCICKQANQTNSAYKLFRPSQFRVPSPESRIPTCLQVKYAPVSKLRHIWLVGFVHV